MDVGEWNASFTWKMDGLAGYIPEECPYCGSPLSISVDLRELVCDNVDCWGSVGTRAVHLLKSRNFFRDGLVKPADIVEYVRSTAAESPYEVYGYSYDREGEFLEGFGEEQSRKVEARLASSRQFSVEDYVRGFGVKGIGSVFAVIVSSLGSLSKGIDYCLSEGSINLSRELGYAGVSVDVMKLLKLLSVYDQTLRSGEDYVDITYGEGVGGSFVCTGRLLKLKGMSGDSHADTATVKVRKAAWESDDMNSDAEAQGSDDVNDDAETQESDDMSSDAEAQESDDVSGGAEVQESGGMNSDAETQGLLGPCT